MDLVTIHTAKTQLSRLIAEGREVIITRYSWPVAKLVPFKRLREDRIPGTATGKIRMWDDFFDPLPEDLLDDFHN